MKLVFATTNAGKLRELRALLCGALEVVSASEIPNAPEVDEDQPSFEGNAEKKARAFAEATSLPSLADDSGLCVEALGGSPGVHSSRYAPNDDARIEKLLEALRDVPDERRSASFRCALCLAVPNGPVVIETGECVGRIVRERRGENGFGYDPIFWVNEAHKTMAELTAEEKNRLSHRAKAFEKMRPHLLALAMGQPIYLSDASMSWKAG